MHDKFARHGLTVACLFGLVCVAAFAQRPGPAAEDLELHPIERPRQLRSAGTQPLIAEAAAFIKADLAKAEFRLSGKGLAAVVLDTGILDTHFDFCGRIPVQRNFTRIGRADRALDGQGHGTNVAGIIAARDSACPSGAKGRHQGIAHDASLIPLKVLKDNGKGSMAWVDEALDWVLARIRAGGGGDRIGVVNVSLALRRNDTSDATVLDGATARKIKALRDLGVLVVVAAGNDFGSFQSREGMAFPAIVRWTTSVGAFYDAKLSERDYGSNGRATEIRAGQITPFSQRLSSDAGVLATDIFAPGASILSAGISHDAGHSEQEGTSQATPMVSAVALLLQEFYLRETGRSVLPSVDDVEQWLREGSLPETDGYGEDDTVANTNKVYRRLDALGAVRAAQRALSSRPR